MIDKKAAIFEAGRELFLLKGFKDINVSDITKKAQVGVGTFYNYYPSKEKLFLEIFIEENRQAKKDIVNALNMDDTPAKIAKDYMMQSMSMMNSNLILKEWYKKDISHELHAYFNERGSADVSFVRGVFAGMLEKWQAEKTIRDDIDTETILSIFDLLAYLDNHQDDIEIPDFPGAIRLLGEFVIRGFTMK